MAAAVVAADEECEERMVSKSSLATSICSTCLATSSVSSETPSVAYCMIDVTTVADYQAQSVQPGQRPADTDSDCGDSMADRPRRRSSDVANTVGLLFEDVV